MKTEIKNRHALNKNKTHQLGALKNVSAIALVLAMSGSAFAQDYTTSSLKLELDPASQTIRELAPKSTTDFNMSANHGEVQNGYYRLGDIDLRLKSDGDTKWTDYSTAFNRKAVTPIKASGDVLSAADLRPTLPDDFPLDIERQWVSQNDELVMRFSISNPTNKSITVGGLGIVLAFANNLNGMSLEEAHTKGVFYDPYIGRDAGYVQVNRLNGKGESLLVLPEDGTPFEDYKPILNARWEGQGKDNPGTCIVTLNSDCEPRFNTNEGHYEWMVFDAGFKDEWAKNGSWNPLSALVLKPGESYQTGLRFITAPNIRSIEDTLIKADHPVAIGLPGYVLSKDAPVDLFLNSPSPVVSIKSIPETALSVSKSKNKGDWNRYKVKANGWGRSQLSIEYADGKTQTVHYFTTKPEKETVDDMGNFLFNEQWFDKPDDPFGRSPSIMTYDRELNKIVDQEHRVWVAGLSDEGGAGAWVAAISKQLIDPNPEEIKKFEEFYTKVIDAHLQVADGPSQGGVKKSLFFYEPDLLPDFKYDEDLNWKTWAAWNKKGADDLGRSYNYPHVALAQWILYKLARNYDGLVTSHDWKWYLDHAYRTSVAMVRVAPHYSQFGQMEGDVFIDILKDLKREGMTKQAADMEAVMKERADHWASLAYPFGSEMPWDSTGQPEVHAWMRYFKDDKKADSTREVILAYDPTIPHWGYNGSARRYWDFLYAGKYSRIERQLHHYGSALNAIPLFVDYRRNPADFHLLRVAFGGLMGTLTNIDQDGFGSAAFHSFPDMRRSDPITGDYGMGFFGHALSTASYLVDNDKFGWVGFGGQVKEKWNKISFTPSDSGRKRIFIEPAGVWLTLDAGQFETISYYPKSQKIKVKLVPQGDFTPAARLRIETTVEGMSDFNLKGSFQQDAGAWIIPMKSKGKVVTLRPEKH